jgi:hypothetical protein
MITIVINYSFVSLILILIWRDVWRNMSQAELVRRFYRFVFNVNFLFRLIFLFESILSSLLINKLSYGKRAN